MEILKLESMIKFHYQQILSITLIALIILVVYGNDLGILINEALQAESLSHVLLIPFFAGLLFYLKKDMVKASLTLEKHKKKTKMQYLDNLIGVALCLIAFLLYWYGSHTFYPLEYHILSIPIFLMGVTLILFNLKVLLILLFPILFLLFLIPPPTEFLYTLGGTMANLNTQASYTLLKTMGLPVDLSSSYGPPTIMLTPPTGQPISFTIDLPCSGIYSLIAFTMFATFLALVTSASLSKKIAVFILGFFLFEILNVIRITAIVSVGYWFGEEIAMNLLHTVAGLLLIFTGMLLILFIAEKVLKIQIVLTPPKQPPCPICKKKTKDSEDFCPSCGRFLNKFHIKLPQKFWAKILLLLLGCWILTLTVQAPTFTLAQGPAGITSSSSWENAENVFPQISDYKLKFLYRDTNYEKIAHQDASLMYAYIPENWSKPTVYVDVGIASSISNLHNWEVCLVAWQTAHGHYPLASVLDSRDIQLLENVPLIARYFTFISPTNYTQITLYWYEKATFNTGITVEQKYVRISLIVIKQTSTEYKQIENQLLSFGQEIANYWQPLKTQSLISLGIPTQQLLLASLTIFVAFTKTAQYSEEQRKKTHNLKIFNNIAPAKEKLLLQTILTLAEQKKAVETREIKKALEESTKKRVKLEELINQLNSLEEYGFIKKDIISIQNSPKLVWKIKY